MYRSTRTEDVWRAMILLEALIISKSVGAIVWETFVNELNLSEAIHDPNLLKWILIKLGPANHLNFNKSNEWLECICKELWKMNISVWFFDFKRRGVNPNHQCLNTWLPQFSQCICGVQRDHSLMMSSGMGGGSKIWQKMTGGV